MKRNTFLGSLAVSAWVAFSTAPLGAQATEGRVFLPTAVTVSIHEFNGFEGLVDGTALPNGTVVPDLSGSGLNATVEGNGSNEITVNAGDPNFDNPPGANRECQRVMAGNQGPRIAVNDDHDAYEMKPGDDFSLELYVDREDLPGTANWGILAGTWHSRNVLDDSLLDPLAVPPITPDTIGAWYGYGLISVPAIPDAGIVEGWMWMFSPVVAGVPRLGDGSGGPAEIKIPANQSFDIPPGRHYVVLSMDRVAQTAIGYVDGVEVARMDNLDPTWEFTTPPGRDHARFLVFSGENDSTLGTYMTSPRGTHLDAVRVQRKALTVDEVNENWINIQNGVPSPPEASITALLVPSATSVIAGQCIALDARGSLPGAGQTINKYEWKVGAGAFQVGTDRHEVSIDTATPSEVEVTLKITNTANQVSTDTVKITVKDQEATARIAVRLGTLDLPGQNLIVQPGSVLSLDGTGSSSVVPAGALQCPIISDVPVEPSPIEEYMWDLDNDGTVDDGRDMLDTEPFNTLGDFTIALKVRNVTGQEGQTLIHVKVTDPQGNSQVFHTTDTTIFHLELNDQPVGPAADGLTFQDLSPSGLTLTVMDLAGTNLEVRDGALQLDDNRALAYLGGGAGPRGEVIDDGDLFEMGPESDFTFEMYVRPGEADPPEWGDLAGTFRARTTDTTPDDTARYGWGIIKSNDNRVQVHTQGYMWFVCTGLGTAGTPNTDERAAAFQLEKGVYSYVACVVNRVAKTSTVFVNGQLAGSYWAPIDETWTFKTPAGYPHAKFYLFTREQKPAEFSNCPPDTAVDALRLQLKALTPEEIQANWENITSGIGTDPPPAPSAPANLAATGGLQQVSLTWTAPAAGPAPTGYQVFRGAVKIADVPATPTSYTDSDAALVPGTEYCYTVKSAAGVQTSAPSNQSCGTPTGGVTANAKRGDMNDDGNQDISDAVYLLSFLYVGGPAPKCQDAGHLNSDANVDISDAVYLLSFLYVGGPAPPYAGYPGCEEFPACPKSDHCP